MTTATATTTPSRDNRNGQLLLRLVDSYNNRITTPVDITLRNQALKDDRRVAVSGVKDVFITDLYGPPNNLYMVEVYPAKGYRPVRRFMSAVTANSHEIVVPKVVPLAVDPRQVKSVEFNGLDSLPAIAQDLLLKSNLPIDESLGDVVLAGYYNIVAKMNRTRLVDRTVLSYFDPAAGAALHKVAGDRLFAYVPKNLLIDTHAAYVTGMFSAAPSTLHTPPVGFVHEGSYKTLDSYGNLQLTFFHDVVIDGRYMVDVDIDDAGGLNHVFQVLHNSLTNEPTHPYNIHEILLVHQELDPRYRFVLA